MMDHSSWTRVSELLEDLYAASEELESLFPGRKFTLDGHLVGSVGEVIAAYMFDLELGSRGLWHLITQQKVFVLMRCSGADPSW